MPFESILITLLIGAIAGWLATMLVRGWGFGLLFNIIIGVLGGLLGAWLLPKLGLSFRGGFVSQVLVATFGALVILVVMFAVQRIGWIPRRRL